MLDPCFDASAPDRLYPDPKFSCLGYCRPHETPMAHGIAKIGLDHDKAMRVVKTSPGRQFDPEVVDACASGHVVAAFRPTYTILH